METITLFFALMLSGIWGWAILATLIVVSSCFWYSDENLLHGFLIVIGGLILWFLAWPSPIKTLMDFSMTFITQVIPVYLVLGLLWSFYKWLLLLRTLKDQIIKSIERAKEVHEHDTREAKILAEDGQRGSRFVPREILPLDSYIDDKVRNNSLAYDMLGADKIRAKQYVPSIKNSYNRDKIINWICYWPMSMIDYIFSKLLRDLLDFIIDFFSGIYNQISKFVLRELLNLQ